MGQEMCYVVKLYVETLLHRSETLLFQHFTEFYVLVVEVILLGLFFIHLFFFYLCSDQSIMQSSSGLQFKEWVQRQNYQHNAKHDMLM